MGLEHLRGVLGRIVGPTVESDAQDPARGFDPEVLWGKMIEDDLRPHAYVNSFTRDILFVKVDSSAYLQEFTLRKARLAERLNRVSGGRIKKLVFSM